MHTQLHTVGMIFQNRDGVGTGNCSIAMGGSGALELGKFLRDDANKRYKREGGPVALQGSRKGRWCSASCETDC